MTEFPDLFRRRLFLAGLASAVTLAAGCSRKATAQRQPLAKDATLLCLGDSLTFGFGAAAGASYPNVLEQLTGHVVQNAGLNGDTAEGALARLPALLQENKPGLVIVSIGGNDFLRKLPEDTTRAALLQIIQAASASAPVVLVAEPQPDVMALASGSLRDHALYASLATQTGVPLFAGGWSAVLSRRELRSDQIHANAEGYRVFAEQLAAWLREMKFIG